MSQKVRFASIEDAIQAGLWPSNKKITTEKGLPELEKSGYHLFYIGKNADLYFIPGDIPHVGLLRTDRASVFNIKLSDTIPGKAKLQTAISNRGFDFAEANGVNTLRRLLPKNIPANIAERFQVMEMARPLEGEISVSSEVLEEKGLSFDEPVKQFELIWRFDLTGSLYKKFYLKGLNPYNLDLQEGLSEWTAFDKPLFTPTTKCEHDLPLNSVEVRKMFPDMISSLEQLAIKFARHCAERGMRFVDTKKEPFLDSNGKWAIGDELFTTESSRFILLENYSAQKYTSMDKEILRRYGELCNWQGVYQEAIKCNDLRQGDVLPVWIPESIKTGMLNAYQDVLNRLK